MSAPNAIQRGSATMNTGDSSITVTLGTSITTTKAFLVYTYKGGNDRSEYDLVDGWISSSTQLTFQRISAPGAGDAITIRWEVVEYASGVTVQRGSETNLGDTNRDVTITSVTTSKAWARTNLKTQFSYGFDQDCFVTANITSSTNLRLRSHESGSWRQTVRWEVVEYTDCSVQKIEQAISGTSATVTLTSVTTAKTMLVLTFNTTSGTSDINSNDVWQGYISNTTTAQFNRDDPHTSDTDTVCLYAVSFTDSTVVRRYNDNMDAGSTSKNVTITGVTLNQSYMMPGNIGPNNTSICLQDAVAHQRQLCAMYLSATTTVNVSRTQSGTEANPDYRFEVISYEAATRLNSFIPFFAAATGGN